MSELGGKELLLAGQNDKGQNLWKIFDDLTKEGITEDYRREILRPHDEADLLWERDEAVIQMRLRLDEALDALTLLEIGREIGVYSNLEPIKGLTALEKLVNDSEAFLRYANAYLYFGVRILAGKLFPANWDVVVSPSERKEAETNRRFFPIAFPPPPENSKIGIEDDFLSFIKIQHDSEWKEALEFLDDFHEDVQSNRQVKGMQCNSGEAVQFELWLRGLLPQTMSDVEPHPIQKLPPTVATEQADAREKATANRNAQNERFTKIHNGLVKWLGSRIEFYRSLQQRAESDIASSKQSKQSQAVNDEITNPVAARFALADLYWISRLLRADVSEKASVSYARVSWIHLLGFKAVLDGRNDLDDSLRTSEKVIRSVFDFVCDLAQNAVAVSDEDERRHYNPEEYPQPAEVQKEAKPWRLVFDEELREIDRQRRRRTYTHSNYRSGESEFVCADDPNHRWSERIITGRQPHNRVAVAFSGGGIRSATFNLGVLQGLQEFDLLRQVDYLSTVSGGGYTGGWLVGNVQRTRHWLGKATCWDESIGHLRAYSSYLAPLVGILRADTWSLGASWVRNTFLIQLSALIWLFAILLAALSSRILFLSLAANISDQRTITIGVIAFVMACLVASTLRFNLSSDRVETGRKSPKSSVIRWLAVLPSWVGSFVISSMLWSEAQSSACAGLPSAHLHDYSHILERPWWSLCFLLLAYEGALFWIGWYALKPTSDALAQDLAAAATGVKAAAIREAAQKDDVSKANVGRFKVVAHRAKLTVSRAWLRVSRAKLTINRGHPNLILLWRSLWIGTLCVIVLYLSLCGIFYLYLRWVGDPIRFGSYAFVFGPALVLFAFALSVVLFIGFSGRKSTEAQREWWTRFGAWLLIYATIGLALSAGAVFGPWLTIKLFAPTKSAIRALQWSTIVTWLGTVIGGLFAGKSSKTAGDGSAGKSLSLEVLAKIGGLLFIVGSVIGAASILYFFLLNFVTNDDLSGTAYWQSLDDIHGWKFGGVFLVVVLIGLLFSWFFEINIFGLSQFYRNRLVRCYLGATRWAPGVRKPHPFTKFDFKDDMLLCSLNDDFRGPFPIFNCTLNLGGSSDLTVHSRHSASFSLTPLRCGADRPKVGYAPTGSASLADADLCFAGGVKLGQAIAISGAAASPNMGYNTSPLVALLLTMFNVRLGWWFPNPGRSAWNARGLRFSLYYLTKELLGIADETRQFLNISDGGHFENLGIYELIRRRCKVIIACDAECDEMLQFGGLGNLIRICATDFGAVIDLDVKSIREQKEGYSLAHCAVGTIKYNNGSIGYLIYLKASVTGDEDVGIEQYRSVHPAFPHETTANQFFSEDQFESYRKLGKHVLSHSLRGNQPGDQPLTVAEKLADVMAPSRTVGEAFLKHTKTLQRIWTQFRQSPGLHSFVDELMHIQPPIAVVPDKSDNPHQASEELCMALELLQLMEDVFMDLRLDDFWEHPDNRGWAIMFMRWARSPRFQRIWNQTRRTFGIRFEYFCEARLGLTRDTPTARV
jgi:hypothetical protein